MGSLGHSWASLGPLLGSLGHSWATLGPLSAASWALLGLSWALLELSCPPLGLPWASLGALLDSFGLLLGSLGALLGLPEGVQKGSQKGTPKKSALEPIVYEIRGPFWGTFLVNLWAPFLVMFFIASWLHLGPQKWPKRLQDDTSKHLKVHKNNVLFRVFRTSPLSSL